MKKLISAPVFFLAGSFLYMIVPWVMYEINYLQVEFLIRAVENHIHLAKHYETIIVDFFVMNLSFTMGYWIAVRCGVTKLHITGMQRFPISKSLIFILLVFISVLGGYKIVSAGVIPFRGYQFDPKMLGPLATVCFTSIWFFHYTNNRKFILIFIITAFWLIGLGSRMFVFLPMLSLMIGALLKYKKHTFSIMLSIIISLVFFIFVGVVRTGWDVNIQTFLGIAFAEPIFTSLGALYYIDTGRDLVNFPYDILASTINFIPSFVFSNKYELVTSLTESDRIFNPMGAQPLVVSLYHNFGLLYPFFMVLIGFYFGYIKKRSDSDFFRAVNLTTLPFVLIHFHREGFITSLKILFFNGIIFPFILIAILKFFLSKKK
ncbi:hypothetical protein PO80_12700 [Vibrio parahaemolyticus]|uniref:hypothetical protein n=12 Tax=Vibrio parahaemolyticus TaxID=670 RepID=UPI0005421776|nr:hypothetical protein [Vibrio parahaemolyticus]KHF15140.1 hypothetical protein PO80_12700 [Vibrio parahaemolyticus]OTV89976.1 hypothetical protein BA739_11425 [Vibrio parahaemolyticus]OTV94209.1 hypothetical protein BA740_10210 [Vibrio parahaemolyticus]